MSLELESKAWLCAPSYIAMGFWLGTLASLSWNIGHAAAGRHATLSPRRYFFSFKLSSLVVSTSSARRETRGEHGTLNIMNAGNQFRHWLIYIHLITAG